MKKRSRKYDYKVQGAKVILGNKPDANDCESIDHLLEDSLGVLKSLEVRCVKECCGLHAFAGTRREISEAVSSEERDEAIELLESLIERLEQLQTQSVRSTELAILNERRQFVEYIEHVTEVLGSGAI